MFGLLLSRDQEKLREHYIKEVEEMKHKYEQMLMKKDELLKNEIEKFDQISIDTKRMQEIEKQQVRTKTYKIDLSSVFFFIQIINQYEQHIRKVEGNYAQVNDEYEKRIEKLISKTHEQVKSMEGLFSYLEIRLLKTLSL